MNPFKHKQLEEFSIEDCELYINKYPYGEHINDVKRRKNKIKEPLSDQLDAKKNKKVLEAVKTLEQIPQTKDTNKKRKQNVLKHIDLGDVGNIVFRILLSAGLVAIVIALIPTVFGAPISIMAAKPAFVSIWEGDCDIF